MNLQEYIHGVMRKTGYGQDIEELFCVTTLMMEHVYSQAEHARVYWEKEVKKNCQLCSVAHKCPVFRINSFERVP